MKKPPRHSATLPQPSLSNCHLTDDSGVPTLFKKLIDFGLMITVTWHFQERTHRKVKGGEKRYQEGSLGR